MSRSAKSMNFWEMSNEDTWKITYVVPQIQKKDFKYCRICKICYWTNGPRGASFKQKTRH